MAVYRFRIFEFDGKIFKKDGEKKKCSNAGAAILHYLIYNRGKAVPKKVLIEHGWRGADRGSGNIHQEIKNLRILLDDSKKFKIIETVRGEGYRFKIVEPELSVEGEEVEPANSQSRLVAAIQLEVAFHLVSRRESVFGERKIHLLRWSKAAREIDLMGTVLNTWFRDRRFCKILKRRLKARDVALRVILPHPDSAFFKRFLDDQRDAEGQSHVDDILQRYDRSVRQAQELEEAAGKKVLLLVEETICSGVVRFDNVIKISAQCFPYVQGNEATLLIEERKLDPDREVTNEIFRMYKKSFDKLWKKRTNE